MKSFFIVMLLTMLLVAGCKPQSQKESSSTRDQSTTLKKKSLAESQREPASASSLSVRDSSFPEIALLKEPIKPVLVEIATEAIPVWRQFKEIKPTLVLASQKAFLSPIPAELQTRAMEVVNNGSRDDLWAASPFVSADPPLLPGMAISAAIEANLFRQVLWILPIEEELQENLTVASLRSQLLASGAMTEEEAKKLTTEPGGFVGMLRNIPIKIVFAKSLPNIDGPILLHFDASYLSPLYKNEVKTPLYTTIHDFLSQLKNTDWHILAVTISRSNFGGELSVDSRFIAPTLAQIFQTPAILEGVVPKLWQLRRDNLYLEVFFQPEGILLNAQEMLKNAPEDPAVHYDLYKAYRLNKMGKKAEEELAIAVKLDPGYAIAYIDMAEQRLAEDKISDAVRYLEKARLVFPDDPILELKLCEAYFKDQQSAKAEELFKRLSQRVWSPVFYPEYRAKIGQD